MGKSNITPDWDTILKNGKNTRKNNTQYNQDAISFPAGNQKTERNRQDSLIKKKNMKHEYLKGYTKHSIHKGSNHG